MLRFLSIWPVAFVVAFPNASAGGELTSDELKFFESKIRPALSKYCYECHAEGEKIKGGLRVDYKDGLLHGGDSGEAVVPGDVEGSLLYTAITWGDADYEMPPKRQMPKEVIADFKTWIEMGAPDPRVPDEVVLKSTIDLKKGREFWAFQKPVATKPPEVKDKDWPSDGIDRFVLAKLEDAGLHPAKEADAATLLRRLSFDLTGLPPTVDEIDAFASAWKADPAKAYEDKVDALLASERYGERWGRHWLDVARFGESTGKEINQPYPTAWRYRDYVIDSMNRDKPYDRFLMEQIAGDLLPIKNDAEWRENLVATGFLAVGSKGLNERNPRQFEMDVADEQIDATSQAVLGLTVSCARCHDHKSDPIPTADYYSLAGIFLSTKTYFGTVNVVASRRGTQLLELPVEDEVPLEKLSQREMQALKTRIEVTEKEFEEARMAIRRSRDTGGGNALTGLIRSQTTLAVLKDRLASFDEEGKAKPFAMGVQDQNRPVNTTVLIRGEIAKPAQVVGRGVPQVLSKEGDAVKMPENASGRLELARWLASEENPLTSRVMVNRIWAKLMGQGLVTSTDNFGATGQLPSHPELLDHLALAFVQNGWSVKAMIKDIVMTKTYRMGSQWDKQAFTKDPGNALLWRHAPRRLDAEEIRDAILVASGDLIETRPKGSTLTSGGIQRGGRIRIQASNFDSAPNYRSVYLPVPRDALPEALDLFDGIDGERVVGDREKTNVPSQALYLMNNSFVIGQSNAMGRKLDAETKDRAQFVRNAFLRCFGRIATKGETDVAMEFFNRFQSYQKKEDQAMMMATFCQGLLGSAEFRYLN